MSKMFLIGTNRLSQRPKEFAEFVGSAFGKNHNFRENSHGQKFSPSEGRRSPPRWEVKQLLCTPPHPYMDLKKIRGKIAKHVEIHSPRNTTSTRRFGLSSRRSHGAGWRPTSLHCEQNCPQGLLRYDVIAKERSSCLTM